MADKAVLADPSNFFCESAEDLHHADARRAMVRLCAEALDSVRLTPLEFLYSDRYQRKLYEGGELLGAFQKAAQTQAKARGQHAQVRQRELVALADAVRGQTKRRAKALKPPRVTPETFAATAADLERAYQGQDFTAAVVGATGTYLDNCASWLIKLFKLSRLYVAGLGATSRHVLDQILAEILINRAAMSELLGDETSLEAAIPILIALHDGADADPDRAGAPPANDVVTRDVVIDRVGALLATEDFPESRAAVAEVIGRIIASPRRFRADEGGSELAVLLDSYTAFEDASEILRQSTIAEGYRLRVGHALSEANLAALRHTAPSQADYLEKILFLYQFVENRYQRAMLEAEVETVFQADKLFDDIVEDNADPIDMLKQFANLHDQIHAAPMDAFRKLAVLDSISAMQARFITETNFFTGLARQVGDIVERGELLIELARAKAFVPGAAHQLARTAIRRTMAEKSFRDGYLADTKDQAAATERLATLKSRLVEAGLMD